MKTVLLLAAFLSTIAAAAGAADNAERSKLSDELVMLMRFETTLRTGWTSYPPSKSEAAADHSDPAAVTAGVWSELKPRYIKAYAEVFSADELRSLIAFFKSPIGQAYLDKTPEVSRRLQGGRPI